MTVLPYVPKSSDGRPALRRLPRSSLYCVNNGGIIGSPIRFIERHPPASVASVDTAHTPMRLLSPFSGVAHVYHKHSAYFPAKKIKIRYVESNVCASYR